LHTDPADAVYVFAPGSLAALAALAIGPKIIDRTGERRLTAGAILMASAGLFSLAFIDQLAPVLAPASPANVARLFGAQPSDALLAASHVSVFTGFATSLSALAVQTYLNRRVPALQQGRVFGLQSMLASAVAIVPLIGLGAAAEATSVRAILFWVPWLVLAVMYGLLVAASRMTGRERPRGREVFDSYWHDIEAEAPDGDGQGTAGGARAPQ
jgi:MFS family permease